MLMLSSVFSVLL